MDDRPTTRPRRTREELRDLTTDWLDVFGLLALAVGLTWGLWALVGPFAILAGGCVTLAGSAFAAYRANPSVPVAADGPARVDTPRRRAPGEHRAATLLSRMRHRIPPVPAAASAPESETA